MSYFRRRFALFEQDGAPAAGGGTAAPAAEPSAPTAEPTAQSHNSAPDWRESIADEDLRNYVTGKGFKDPGEAFKALRDAEAKYAAPAKPEDYQIGDTDFAKTASTWFHKHGVPAETAKALTTEWNQHMQAMTEQAATERMQKGERDMSALKTEWGQEFDKNVELGRQAMRKFGLSVEFVDKLAGETGDAETIKVFSRIGAAMSEATLNPGGAGGSGAALTHEQRAAKFYSNS